MKPLLFLLFASATPVLAMSGTDQLVGEYAPIEQAKPGWAKGLYEMLLDPARKVGWCSWFSECPNDLEQYAFAVRTTADAQRLLNALAKVEGPQRLVELDPGRGPRGLGDWQPKAEGREWGAVLMVGNERVLLEWYGRLKTNAEGKKQFGAQVFEKPPQACPPTLRLYLGTATIDPAALVIPKGVTVRVIDSSSWPGKDYEKMVETLKALQTAQKTEKK